MAKRGLWDNIHAKRKRIKEGSGERMRKPGSKGAPTAADFKAAQGLNCGGEVMCKGNGCASKIKSTKIR